jgi:hypothetical protein
VVGKVAFSRARCCATCRTDPAGRTGTSVAAASAVAAGLLEFEGHHVHVARERADGVEVIVEATTFLIGHLARGRVGVRREDVMR